MLSPTMEKAWEVDNGIQIREAIIKDQKRDKFRRSLLTDRSQISPYPHPTGPIGITPRKKFSVLEMLSYLIP